MNENAKNALKEYREKVASGEIEVVRLNPIQKAKENPTSLRLAINAMCYSCLGSGTPQEIRDCSSKLCPLHTVRPYQDKKD